MIPFWDAHVVDPGGGYLLAFAAWAGCAGGVPRRIVTQARTMWFFSRLARSAYGTSHHLDWAAHGFRFLCDSIWDRRHGGFHWELREGRVSDDQKHLYGQAFGLLALVEFARASGETEARELAGELFDLLERHAHDDPFGGYLESLTGDWRVGTNTDTVNRSMRTFP